MLTILDLMHIRNKKQLRTGPLLQAGVAIGLSLIAETALPEYGQMIRTIILSATVIYELFGPVITKMAMMKAGEISVNN